MKRLSLLILLTLSIPLFAQTPVRQLQVRRGLKADLPTLADGEPGLAEDTQELFIGTTSGNLKVGPGSGVTSVSATSPVVSSGGTLPNISIPQSSSTQNGYLASADWTTFNLKQAALSFTAPLSDTSNTVSLNYSTPLTNSGGNLTLFQANTTQNGYLASSDWTTFNAKLDGVSVLSPLTSSGGSSPTLSIPAATTTQNGYLSSADWTTFNSKASALGYTPVNLAGDTMTGTLTVPSLTSLNTVGIGTNSPQSALQVVAPSNTVAGGIIQGAASQTADLLDFKNSSGTILNKTNSIGNITIGNGTQTDPNAAAVDNEIMINDSSASLDTQMELFTPSGGSFWYQDHGDANTYFGTLTSGGNLYFVLNNDATPHMTLSNGGLQVQGNASGSYLFEVYDNNAGSPAWDINNQGALIYTNTGANPPYAIDTQAYQVSFGSVNSGNITASGSITDTVASSTQTGMVVKGAASQSANLMNFENSAGTVLSYVDSAGNFSASMKVEFFTSSKVSTDDAGTTSTTFVTSPQSPALTFTPAKNGTCKVYSPVSLNQSGVYGEAVSRIYNTSGGATLLSESDGIVTNVANSEIGTAYSESTYTVTGGVPYVFDIQTKLGTISGTGATVIIAGNFANFYMYAECWE